MRLERDLLPEDQLLGCVLGLLAAGLAFLRAVDPAEADAFSVVIVQNFEGVAVDYPDCSSGEVGSCQGSAQQKKDAGTAAAKTDSCPTSQSSVPRYPSRWASTTN